jgi:hypothetical protein
LRRASSHCRDLATDPCAFHIANTSGAGPKPSINTSRSTRSGNIAVKRAQTVPPNE